MNCKPEYLKDILGCRFTSKFNALEQNNKSQQNNDSTQVLSMVIKLIALYARAIRDIGQVSQTYQGRELKKNILQPYLVIMYGKALTSYRLLNGYALQDLHPKMLGVSNDVFTPYDLIRALYECYLQSSFLIHRYQTEDEIQYMGRWWHCRAFSERAILAQNRVIVNPKTVKEASFIQMQSQEINQNYAVIKARDIKEFGLDKASGLAAWPKPGKLFSIAGVHKSQHQHLYKFNSIYAHCEPLSILQLGEAAKPGVELDVNGYILTHGTQVMNLMALGLQNFSLVFSEVERLIKGEAGLSHLLKSAKLFWETDPVQARKDHLANQQSSS